jgi:hypothetical protein
MKEILFAVGVQCGAFALHVTDRLLPSQDDFVASKATPEAKEKFVKAVLAFVSI